MNGDLILNVFAVPIGGFFAVMAIAHKRNAITLIDNSGEVHSIHDHLARNLFGILLFGFPLVRYFTTGHVYLRPIQARGWLPLVTISFLVACAAFVSFLEFLKKTYTSPRRESHAFGLNFHSIMIYFMVRALFLAVYEFFFRGLFLMICQNSMGTVPAISINLFFYGLLHFWNGRRGMLVCIPFGLLLCGVCIWTQSVWPAVIIHLVLALIYECYLLSYYHSKPKTLQR